MAEDFAKPFLVIFELVLGVQSWESGDGYNTRHYRQNGIIKGQGELLPTPDSDAAHHHKLLAEKSY